MGELSPQMNQSRFDKCAYRSSGPMTDQSILSTLSCFPPSRYCRYTCGRCGSDAGEDKGNDKGQDPDCDYTYAREVRRQEKKGRRGKRKARKKKNGRWKVSKYMKKPRSKATTLDDHYRARDPCRCTETGISGHVDTHHKGCFTFRPRWSTWWTRSSERPNQICYVADPHTCEASRESRYYSGAKWRNCHN